MADRNTYSQAAARRDDGMQRAVEHADAVDLFWSERAYGHVMDFCRTKITFLTEDARAFAEGRGLQAPPDGRAWGAVMQRAARNGLMKKAGYAPAKSSNLSPKVLWEAL
jgi:hypothetical protein